MSNQIRLKRGSGSDPSASDLVTGEIAIRTDNGKLFTKRDNGNVTEITGGGGIDDGDKGDITVSNSGGTFTIDNGVVNNAKVASNAAIAGSKISPDFGSQDIVTTGNIDLSNSTGSGNNRIKIGANDEIQIFRSGTESLILENQGNNLTLAANRVALTRADRHTVMLLAIANGGVELYHNNSKKLETDSNGVTISGRLLLGDSSGANDNRIRLGADGDLSLFHSGTSSFILNDTGNLIISNMDPDDDNDIHLRARQNEESIVCKNDGATELYHNGNKKLETTSTGIAVTGSVTPTGDVNLGDSSKIALGNSADLQLFHDSSHSSIKNITGNFSILSDTILLKNAANSESFIRCQNDGVELYHANSLKLSTYSGGFNLTGKLNVTGDIDIPDNSKLLIGTGDDLQIYHDGNNSVIDSNTGNLYIQSAASILMQGANNENVIKYVANGAVELYHDNSKKFETSSSGGTLTGNLDVSSGIDVTGVGTFNGGTSNASNDATLFVTATNNNDWGLKVDKYNGSATEYGARIEVGSSATYALQVTGNDSEVFRIQGNGNVVSSGSIDVTGGITASNTGNASLVLDAGTGSQAGNQISFIDFKLDGTLKGNIAINEAVSGTPLEINSAGSGATKLYNAGSVKFQTTSAGAIVSGDMFATHSNGQVECKASDGCIEITRTGGAAFIDFKNSTGEDFDARISELNGGFNFTGSSTINGVLAIGGTSVSGNEGGEMHIKYAPNSSLSGDFVVFDQVVNSIRFFEHSGNNRGFYLDFTTAGNGASSTIWHSGNDGAGSGLDADTLDGQQASAFVTTSGTTFSGDVGFSGGAGAANINANSDIRFAQGTWTGEATKIQGHNNYMYIQGGSNGIIFRRSNGTDNWFITSAGHFIPGPNNSLDLGGTSNRIRNIYTNDLNLSNEGGSNDVDGTWGSYTIQEGADDLFLINRRNGKKYKFNLTEVS